MLRETYPDRPFATDYVQTLITTEPLFPEVPEYVEQEDDASSTTSSSIPSNAFTFTIQETHQLAPHTLLGEIEIKIVNHKSLDMSTFETKYLKEPNVDFRDNSTKGQYLQALNIIAGHYPRSCDGVSAVGSNKHYAISPIIEEIDLQYGLFGLKGLFLSIRLATNQLLANVQIKAAGFYKPQPLQSYINEFCNRQKARLDLCELYMKRLVVKLSYGDSKLAVQPRLETVFGFGKISGSKVLKITKNFATIQDVQFWWEPSATQPNQGPARLMTVLEYFTKVKGVSAKSLLNGSSFAINVGNAEHPRFVPAALCHIIEGQVCRRQLEPSQTTIMVERFAVRRPHENVGFIAANQSTANAINGLRMLGFHSTGITSDDLQLAQFSIEAGRELITIPGFCLKPPSIVYNAKKGQKGQQTTNPSNGGWFLQQQNGPDRPFIQVVNKVAKYLVIQMGKPINPTQKPPQATDLTASLNNFGLHLEQLGISNGMPQYLVCPHAVSETLSEHTMKETIKGYIKNFKIKFNEGKEADFVMFILQGNKTQQYAYNIIKSLCDVELGIINICAQRRMIMEPKGRDSYVVGIAHKLNLKLGGTNHKISADLYPHKLPSTMMIGYDLIHPPPGSSPTAPSIAAVVANVDNLFLGQWPGASSSLPP